VKRTSPEKEAEVLEMVVKQGASLREASRKSGVPLTTVRAIVERYLEVTEKEESAQGDLTSENEERDEEEFDDPRTLSEDGSEDIPQTRHTRGPVNNLGSTRAVPQTRSALERDNAILRNRIESLVGRLSQLEAATSSGGIAADSVAGRPSLASFRENTWKRFAGAVMGLPDYVREHGREATEELIAATLTADLHTLALGPPPTPRIARMRNTLTHFLTNPAFLNVFMARDYAGQQLRMYFLKWVSDVFYRPSVAKLFDKSVENWLPPGGWGDYGQ
jgi:hypothetical protein